MGGFLEFWEKCGFFGLKFQRDVGGGWYLQIHLHKQKIAHVVTALDVLLLKMSNSKKYPYLNHGWLFGILREMWVLWTGIPKGCGGWLVFVNWIPKAWEVGGMGVQTWIFRKVQTEGNVLPENANVVNCSGGVMIMGFGGLVGAFANF